jgi:hypothetical protein
VQELGRAWEELHTRHGGYAQRTSDRVNLHIGRIQAKRTALSSPCLSCTSDPSSSRSARRNVSHACTASTPGRNRHLFDAVV